MKPGGDERTEWSAAADGGTAAPWTGYAPGQVLAGRYRIVALLGRGGMGEVYRADDLTLGAPVALKFLPRDLADDGAARDRFLSEARTARRVSHPHVCRVFDVDEADGRRFLSMEYVDGEDLASLLRRVGRLAPAKGVEVARQLCAGLSAAHDQGVLHRDLKPANVMIDGFGRVRIADFGLAVAGGVAAELAGTPAYMAPEQFAGAPATVQSDVYALGLVLYEIFTGARAIDAEGLAAWRRAHDSDVPSSLSSRTPDVDPVVDRVVMRCLEKEPARRPRSVRDVSLALPGGDPLAMALAAGETPSPGMVAAAGGEGALTPRTAGTLLAVAVTLVAALVAVAPHAYDLGLAPMKKSPEVLADRAREVATQLGQGAAPTDEVSWIERDYRTLRWLADSVPSTTWRAQLARAGAPVLLHYRRSDRPLVPTGPVVSDTDPAPSPGEVRVILDSIGRVRRFAATSPPWMPSKPIDVDPREALGLTGLDVDRLTPVAPEWMPDVAFDTRYEWRGTDPDFPALPVTVSVAALGGRVVSVAVVGPWARDMAVPEQVSWTARLREATQALLVLSALLLGLDMARRNLNAGRGDSAGAFRVAVAVAATGLVVRIATLHLVPSAAAVVFQIGLPALGAALTQGFLVWVSYMSLEPYMRRRQPELLIGWARWLAGRWRDPRMGADVLWGSVWGLAMALLLVVANALPTWVEVPHQTPVYSFILEMGLGERLQPVGSLGAVANTALMFAVTLFATLFLARILVPLPRLAVALWLLVTTVAALGAENPAIEVPLAIASVAVLGTALLRHGLLALVATWITFGIATRWPIGLGWTTWYAAYGVGAVVLILSTATAAAIVSTGGRWTLRRVLGES